MKLSKGKGYCSIRRVKLSKERGYCSPLTLPRQGRESTAVAAYYALPRVHYNLAFARGFVDSLPHGSPTGCKDFSATAKAGKRQQDGKHSSATPTRPRCILRVKVRPEAELTMRARAFWTRHEERNIRPKHYCSRGCATDSRCRTRPNNCVIRPDRRKHKINKEGKKIAI